jgi:membrane-bound lytic murein transglycosylase D
MALSPIHMTDKANTTIAVTAQATSYKVQKGDTLGQIASRYRVSVEDLMRWNGLPSAKALRAGQYLQVSGPVQIAARPSKAQLKVNGDEAQKAAYHMVRKGDTLYNIASRYGVSVDDLMRWNHLKKATSLQAGQTIRVSGNGDTKVAKFGKN